MSTVVIFPGASDEGFTAFFGDRRVEGKTAGAALDALAGQLSDELSASLVLVQSMKPDRFFDASQQTKLRQFMEAWQQDSGDSVPAELLKAVDDELKATIERSKALLTQPA